MFQTFREKKIVAALAIMVVIVITVLLVNISLRDDVLRESSRAEKTFTEVTDVNVTENKVSDAPIGIIKEYEFTLDDNLKGDTSLAFYTVHQYVTVKIDGEEVYRISPSGDKRITKTIASNWVIIPLYTEDSGKEVCVEIAPIYESFRNRQIDFLIGNAMEIYRSRLMKDLPELILSGLAIIIGIVFLCIACYSIVRKRKGNDLLSLGLFSVMLGVWRFLDTRFTPFMDFGKPVLVYYISIIMPMLGIMPIIQWTKSNFTEKSQKILEIYETCILILCLAQFGLQLLSIVDIRQIMITTHISMGIGALCIIAIVIYERKYKSEAIELKMALICIVGIMMDVFAFYIKGNSSGLVFTLLAFLIYIVCMGVLSVQRYTRQQMEIARLDRQLTDSRIKAMMSQIRSHFIFNVLATISTYCKVDPKEADRALITFSRYLRRNIQNIEEDGLIDFRTELEQVEDYVELEQLRFGDRIIFETDIETTNFQIPPLTIQPIVENAIKHGIIEHGKSGVITLQTRRDKACIEIMVTDNGVGFDVEQLEKSESVGIRNVRYRIENMLEGTLEYKSTVGEGTKVMIKIPFEKKL